MRRRRRLLRRRTLQSRTEVGSVVALVPPDGMVWRQDAGVEILRRRRRSSV